MVAFTQAQLSGLTIANPTSLQFGPDGKLYISQTNGVIAAVTVTSDGAGGYTATNKETINLVRAIPNHNDDGTFNAAITTRQVTGILVTGTADKPVLYVSSSDPRIGGGATGGDTGLDTNSGTLSRLTKNASGAWVKEDLVIGLPRSEENHAVNGLQINPANGHILLTVGGQTNAGAPSQEFGYLSEYAYGSSIVDIDVAAIDTMPSKTYRGQTYKYALPTVDDPTRPGSDDIVNALDPEVFGGNNGLNQARLTPDSPVQIYATGFRNLYDIAVNENGQIYGVDNGGNPTWGGPPLYRQPDGTLGPTPNAQVTNAVNDGSGSVNKAPLHLIEEGYYGGHAAPIRANPTGAGLYQPDGTPVPLPADWPPVPASMANPVDGYYLPPGFNRADILPSELETPLNLRGELGTFVGSVNGIDDYRASAFNGEMRGDLVAASLNDDSIYRVDLSADGKTVLGITNLTPTGVLGNGSALDVHAAPATGPFAGTLWVASYGGGITVLTPGQDPGPPPAQQDTDSDGLSNIVDPFPVDPTNGQSVLLEGDSSLVWSFSQNEPHPGPGGIGNLGFTGVMLNGVDPYTAQYDPNKTIMGGAASGVLIQDITAGTSLTNTQTDAYQFGIDIGADVATYTVTGKVNNPFDGTTPQDNQSVGFFIGTGDQANYVRFVAGAATFKGVANTPVIDIIVESGNAVVAHQTYAVPVFGSGQKAITASDAIFLSFNVDPVLGTVTPTWTVSRGSTQSDPGDLFTGSGTAIPLSGELLEAIRGTRVLTTSAGASTATGLAVGIIATSEGPGAPFPATFNAIDVTSTAKAEPEAGVAELIFTPNAGINVSTFDPNTIKLNNLSQSGNDLKQVVINFSQAILPDGVFFDPNAAGGDNGKPFQINSQTGSFTASASYQIGSATTGYRQMTLDFNDFNPGEGLSFSLDIDPDSLLGFKQSVPAGGVSGAELAGSHVSFIFADGSITQADLFGSGVAQTEARGVSNLHAAPTVSLQNVSSGNIVYPAGDPTISVQGAPGSTVRVQMMAVAQQDVPFSSPFEGNTATNVVYETIVLDAAGLGTISATLPPNRVLVVAAAEVDTSGHAISAVSADLRIIQQSAIPAASIVGTANSETLEGTSGSDSIDALGGDDILNGLEGDDYLNGGAGNDRMVGGLGDDVYVVDSTGDVVVEAADGGTDTVRTSLTSYTLAATLENLIYTGTKAFTGTGNALANQITGSEAGDRLSGLGGADTLTGGLGNDTYIVDNVGDVVVELVDQGNDRILSQVSYVLSDNVETLQLTSSAKINATGNSLANTLIGNAGANLLDGKGGADILTGGAGADTFGFSTVLGSDNLDLGSANVDRITDFVAVDDTIQLDAGVFDGLTAGPLAAAVFKDLSTGALDEDDRIVYDRSTGSLSYDADGRGSEAAVQFAILSNKAEISAADFTIVGVSTGPNVVGGATTGNDSLTGTSGNDLLDGGAGADSLRGLGGNDIYVVDNAGDIVTEALNQGIDTIKTSLTSYTLGSNIEKLTYTGTVNFSGTGNELTNTITGSFGSDKLNGKLGADTLIGGAGNDTYTVDNGGDVVVELANQGTDRVLATVSYTLSDNVENLTLTTSAALSGTGNGLANTLVGNGGANVLDGKGGADTLTGGGGNDTFVFWLGETHGDKVMDFTGAGATVGDHLEFRGFGSFDTGATLTHAENSDLYTITADAAHGGASETFQLVGVTNLDLLTGTGHNDVMLFA
ncbi:hypothetical protein [Methylobacterium sp. Leaf111]|uniref:hypothetical protein n=1 Tax=Methylobacterium sp. Leaf111 TaxID=1736257 RepID=UPI000AF4BC8B|nr:hypothetical protein [Methylobacterium sp. Leaf111]